MGKYQDSINLATQVLQIEPDNIEITYQKGVSLYYLGQYNNALEYFEKVLKLDFSHFHSAEKKLVTLIWLRRFKEAIDFLETSDLPKINQSFLLNNIGFAYRSLQKYKEAESYFLQAKSLMYPKNDLLYYNLFITYKGLKDYKKGFVSFFLYVIFKQVNKIMPYLLNLNFFKNYFENKKRGISSDIEYEKSGKMFLFDKQHKEKASIFKLFRTPNYFALCNDSWEWFAINIPYKLLNKDLPKGDIDILVKMVTDLEKENSKPIYRGFEVKNIRISKDGVYKSLKVGMSKHKTISKQLKKLKKFGCQQVFFFEIYTLERGYSSLNSFPDTKVANQINQKIKNIFSKGDFGYVVVADEPSPHCHEDLGGIGHRVQTILPTKLNSPTPEFLKLVNYINQFYKIESQKVAKGFPKVITFCEGCKSLIILDPRSLDFNCYKCGKNIYS